MNQGEIFGEIKIGNFNDVVTSLRHTLAKSRDIATKLQGVSFRVGVANRLGFCD